MDSAVGSTAQPQLDATGASRTGCMQYEHHTNCGCCCLGAVDSALACRLQHAEFLVRAQQHTDVQLFFECSYSGGVLTDHCSASARCA
jgi:hypothetical protein